MYHQVSIITIKAMRFLLLLLVAGLSGWASSALPAPFGKPITSQGEPDFRLRDAKGAERRLADFRGRVVALAFGYTQCPDYCPTTLARLAQTTRQLQNLERFVPIFVTLDPERDTPAVVADYVTAFHPGLLGLRGDLVQTGEAAKRFRVLFEKVHAPEGGYSIDHGGGIFLIDSKGVLRLKEPDNLSAEQIAQDIELLLQEQ